MTKKTKMGKINVPLDIRNEKDIPAFEKTLANGPMMIVLVYADWCGHCTKYKENVWSPLKSVKNRTMNMASVHYDQLPNTSLKNAKIDGYPSLLVVGKDKTPATFKSPTGARTNALPKANDFTTMKNLVSSPVVEKESEEVVLPNISKSASSFNNNISSSLEPSSMEDNLENSIKTTSQNTTSMSNTTLTPNTNLNISSVKTNNVSLPKVSPSTTMNEQTPPIMNEQTPPIMNEQTPPTISEDVVSLTNAASNTVSPRPAETQVTMMGGKLYKILSLKNKRSKRRVTKKRRTSKH